MKAQGAKIISYLFTAALVITCGVLSLVAPALADEGGMTEYYVGLSDVLAGFVPEPGTYVLSRTFYFDKEVGQVSVSGVTADSAGAHGLVELLNVTHVTGGTLLGGRYGFSLLLPIARASALAGLDTLAPGMTVDDSNTGVGDLILAPLILGWEAGEFSWNTSFNVYAPTGEYDKDRLVSIGRNVWALEQDVGLTWLDREQGHEISLYPGITVQFENPATDYVSAPEFHLDYAVAQHLGPRLAIGLGGYVLQQLGGDHGAGATAGDFTGRLAGLGPLVVYNADIGGVKMILTGKFYSDIDDKNLLHGSTAWLGVDFAL